jgi:hypothetical protein
MFYGPAASRSTALGYYLDPESGIRLEANVSRRFTRDIWNGGDTIEWTTNSVGYRGPELRTQADYRILIFGDSNIQAQFSTLANTYAMVLQTILSTRTGRTIEVINAGTIGAGPDQNLGRMSDELPRLRPDLVILHVFADNDFGDLLRNALYYLDRAGQLARSGRRFTYDRAFAQVGRRYPLAILQFASDVKNAVLTSVSGQASAEPDTPAEIIETWLKKCADEFEDYQSEIAGQNPDLESVLADHYDYDLALFPDLASSRMKVALMEAVLRRAKQIADENSAHFLLLIQPSVHDVSSNLLVTPQSLRAYSSEYRPDRLTSIVQVIAEANHIESINLFSDFAAAASHLYFRGTRRSGQDEVDNHWNDEGQRRAAALTADLLQERIASQPRPAGAGRSRMGAWTAPIPVTGQARYATRRTPRPD